MFVYYNNLLFYIKYQLEVPAFNRNTYPQFENLISNPNLKSAYSFQFQENNNFFSWWRNIILTKKQEKLFFKIFIFIFIFREIPTKPKLFF